MPVLGPILGANAVIVILFAPIHHSIGCITAPIARIMPAIAAAHETNETFRTLARRLLVQGQAEKEVLAKHGPADKLLDDLAAAVEEFDASVTQSNEGRRGHVGAVAELQAVSDEVMRLVEMLDGLNRYRFGGRRR